MATIRDMFHNAFPGNIQSIGDNNKYGNENNHKERRNSRATNLTESNDGIAKQATLYEELMSMKDQQPRDTFSHRDFFPTFSATTNTEVSGIKTSKPDITDDIISNLSRKLNTLTMTEREQAQNDIYGFRQRNQKEDPLELTIWMNEMDDLIQKGIASTDKRFSALRLAMHTNINHSGGMGATTGMSGPEFVRSQKLKFLRASHWVVEDAVYRMALFFEIKLEHFGSECLVRDLTMKDLTAKEISLWKQHGFLQLAEERDAYGRAILVVMGKQQFYIPQATVIRCFIYFSSVLTRDESIQLAGAAQLYWAIDQEFTVTGRARPLIHTYKALPLRFVASHICYNHVGLQPFFELLAQIPQTFGVARIKVHKGTAMECFYNMMTYGIPRRAIAINNDNEVELEFITSFLDSIQRNEIEEEKLRRQERLDKQIKQLQLLNRMPYNDTMDLSQESPGISNQRGEPYQREPPTMSIDDGDNESAPKGRMSWESASNGRLSLESVMNSRLSFESAVANGRLSFELLGGVDPLSLPSEEFDSFPEEIVRGLAQIGTSTPNNNNPMAEMTLSSVPAPSPIQNNAQSKSVNNNETPENSKNTPQNTGSKEGGFIAVPDVLDVIMGRGRHNKKKPGNRKLNNLLESYQDEYETSDKFQKTVLAEIVVKKMIEDGSRFLVRDTEKKSGLWIEVSMEKARDKVAHDFRNLRRNAKIAATDTSGSDNDMGGPKRRRSSANMMERNSSKGRRT